MHRYDNGTFYPASKTGHFSNIGQSKGKYHHINVPFNTEISSCGDYVSKIGDEEYIYIFQHVWKLIISIYLYSKFILLSN